MITKMLVRRGFINLYQHHYDTHPFQIEKIGGEIQFAGSQNLSLIPLYCSLRLQQIYMMNGSLLPERKQGLSSKSLGLESIEPEQVFSYKLLHVNNLTKKKELDKKYNQDKESEIISYYQNKGLLSAIPKLQSQKKRLIKIKSSLKDDNSYLTSPQKDHHSSDKRRLRRDRLFTLSNKRVSTSITNDEESPQSHQRQQMHLLSEIRHTKTLESGGAGIRVRRKRKVTINEFLQERNQKVRDYECSKLSRTDIIPHYLLFSQKFSKNQEQKLIKNISERVCPTYKIYPNFQALEK